MAWWWTTFPSAKYAKSAANDASCFICVAQKLPGEFHEPFHYFERFGLLRNTNGDRYE